ncbi:MAG: hypothetical protein KDB14_33845 [Planctomycetales bacterium]|nr:hypothetical protein [Planctomycetales bacterium]
MKPSDLIKDDLGEEVWADCRPRTSERVQGLIGTTSASRSDDLFDIRAVTLCGWMHDKRNLGIEHIHISKSGAVHLEKREVLSKKIFKSVPQIRY